MVGTAADIVTSSASMSSAIGPGSVWTSGSTCLAPTNVAAYGSPQPLAWNIGTTGRTTSDSLIPFASTWPAIALWR